MEKREEVKGSLDGVPFPSFNCCVFVGIFSRHLAFRCGLVFVGQVFIISCERTRKFSATGFSNTVFSSQLTIATRKFRCFGQHYTCCFVNSKE